MKTNLFTTLAFSAMLTLASLTSNAQTPVLDQQNGPSNSAATFFSGQTFGQSFTAGLTGSLTSVSIGLNFGAPTTACVVKVFAGSGFGGTLLATKNFTTTGAGYNTVTLNTGISVITGNVYTFQFSTFTASIPVNFHTANPYSGGSFFNNGVASGDAIFQTYVAVPTTTTQLTPAFCNTTLTTLDANTRPRCTPATGATDYEWQFTDASTGLVVFTKQRGAQWTDFYLTGYWPTCQYNKTYSVKVRAKIAGVWGAYGTACTLTTPSTSLAPTQLTSLYCNTTLSSFNSSTIIRCNQVLGATDYEYQFTDVLTNAVYTKLRSGQWTDFYVKTVSQIAANKSYSVKVRAYVGGVWGTFGTACLITTPAPGARFAFSDTEETEIGSGVNVNAYPNPTSETLNIDFDNMPANASIEIYNMVGELVLTQSLSEMSNIVNTSSLTNGMYFTKIIGNKKLLSAQKIMKQ